MKLNQVIAIEKNIKSRTHSELSRLHHQCQKSDQYNGFSKSYTPKDIEGEVYPNEEKRVQNSVEDDLNNLKSIMTELLDITAMKDFGNTFANADVVVDGITLIEKAPVSYLLFLEKEMIDIRTFVDKLPELDPSDDWQIDVNSGLFKTTPYETHKTKKLVKPIVLYDATKEHAAQTQLITEDVVVGYWKQVKSSGAITKPYKKLILERISKVSDAIKSAREQANCFKANEVKVGNKLFDYLF